MNAAKDLKIRRRISVFLFVVTFFLVCTAIDDFLTKSTASFEGNVIKAERACLDIHPESKRCWWEYSVLNPEGEKEKLLGGMRGFLKEEIAEGSYLKKEKWAHHYYINERKESVNIRHGLAVFSVIFFIPLALFFSRKEIRAFFVKKEL